MRLCRVKDSEGRKSVRRLKPGKTYPSTISPRSSPPSTPVQPNRILAHHHNHWDMPPYEPWRYPSSSYNHPILPHPELSGCRVQSLGSDDDFSFRPRRSRSRRPSRARPTRPQPTPDLSSLVVSPQKTTFPIPIAMSFEPSIPFAAAARQLDHTVRRAIVFFDKFYGTFRETSDGLRFHAPEHLMNTIWRSQIRESYSSPDHPWGRKKKTSTDPNDQQQQDQVRNRNRNQNQNNYNDPNNQKDDDSRSSSPDELLSFSEFQKQLLSRLDQVMRSKPPPLAHAAASSSSRSSSPYSIDFEEYDEEFQRQKVKQHSAAKLKTKIVGLYPEFKSTLEEMGKEHLLCKSAIRECKIVKQILTTYRRGWDKDWSESDDEGSDSDSEDTGRGRGDRNGHN